MVLRAARAVIFGSDGGGEAFAFTASSGVVVVPWIGLAADAIPQGTFTRKRRCASSTTIVDAIVAGPDGR